MLLRNALVLLGCLLCLAQNLNAQNFYYTPDGKLELEISTEKIWIQFKNPTDEATQKLILTEYKNQIELNEITLLPSPQISILKLKNLNSDEDVHTLLQKIKTSESIEFASYFLAHPDGTLQGVSDKILVGLQSPAQMTLIDRIFDEFEGIESYARNPYDPFILKIKVHKDRNALALANEMHELGVFEYVEPDFLRLLKKMNTNDPNVDEQWSLNNDGINTAQYNGQAGSDMNIFNAWSTTTGTSNIKVAIIDEGVDLDHPDLVDNLLPGFDATGQGSMGGEYGDDAHGTACAGIVAASGNNNLGGVGVAYNCKIIPIRIAYSAGNNWITYNSWVANGLNWAWQNGNADILSNSWGGGGASAAINSAINGAINNGRGGLGSPVLFAAGNDNGDVTYPATYDPTIAVIAMSMCNQRKMPNSCDGEFWWGSNYGEHGDIAAPGVKIFTTDIAGSNGYSNNDFTTSFNGTSSACPNAAGVMALILSNDNSLTAQEARFALESTAEKVGGYNYTDNVNGQPNGTWSPQLGYGRINAVNALNGGGTPPPPTASNDAGILDIVTPSGNVCDDVISPEVVLKNYGTSNLTAVSIIYGISGGVTSTYNWNGNLPSNTTATLTLPNITFPNGNHTLTTTTFNPNYLPDDNPNNDAHTINFSSGENNLTLTLNFDAQASQTSWDIQDGNGTIIFSGGNYGNQPSGSTIEENICLQEECYTFNIYDSGGNGMCCDVGDGSYQLTESSSGNIIASGGTFINSESTNFCLPISNLPTVTVALVGGNNVSCNGGDDGWIIVAASGGNGNYSYMWEHGATGSSAMNLTAGNYSVTATDGISSAELSVYISEPSPIIVEVITTNATGTANGSATAVVSGGNPSYTYQWSNGATGIIVNNLAAGNYTLTVSDIYNCIVIKSFQIIDDMPTSLIINVLDVENVLCNGESSGVISVEAMGGTGNYAYNWSNGMVGGYIENIPTGTYTVTATDGNLSGTKNITITEPSPLVLTMTSVNVVNGNDGGAIVDVDGGTPSYFYLWNNGAVAPSMHGLSAGTYTVTVTDMNGCTASESVEVLGGNIPPDLDYCESTAENSNEEWIHFLKLGNVSHISGNDGGYGDHTSIVIDLEKNKIHPIILGPKYSGPAYKEYWSVWIDFNQDMDFDDMGERVLVVGPSNTVVEETIYIPANVPEGVTRMRVSMMWNGIPQPCSIFSYGEVEDYTVNIKPNSGGGGNVLITRLDEVEKEFVDETDVGSALMTHVALYPNPTSDILNLSLYAKEKIDANIIITDMVGREVFSKNLSLENDKYVFPIDVSNYDTGIYNLKINGKRTQIIEQFSVHR